MDEQRTEAACLLDTGALYRRRIGLEPTSGGDLIFAGFKHGAFSLYYGDEPIYHFDLEGRWQRCYIDGLHYLKGLDAEIHMIERRRERANLVLHRRKLSFGEASDLDDRIRSVALNLMANLADGRFRRVDPPDGKAQPLGNDELRDFLEQIGRWNAAAWFAHRERYTATYGPLPFLPPECQNAVVLQATLGHANGQTFGLSAAAEPYVRSAEEFAQHVREVSALWGRRLLQSRLLFLAGDDVLHQPFEQVKAYLDSLNSIRTTAESRFESVHAFLDEYSGLAQTSDDWSQLNQSGLGRISLGVESGDPEVREAHGKQWDDDALRSTVAALKGAGIGISVLTLVGAGGAERADTHIEATAGVIASLNLTGGDFVFLLDEREVRAPGVVPPGLTTLDQAAWIEQQQRLKDALGSLKERGVKVLPYTLEKQWT